MSITFHEHGAGLRLFHYMADRAGRVVCKKHSCDSCQQRSPLVAGVSVSKAAVSGGVQCALPRDYAGLQTPAALIAGSICPQREVLVLSERLLMLSPRASQTAVPPEDTVA